MGRFQAGRVDPSFLKLLLSSESEVQPETHNPNYIKPQSLKVIMISDEDMLDRLKWDLFRKAVYK